MDTKIINALKNEVVRARLAAQGVTDPAQVAAVAARMTVTDAGAVVGTDASGRLGVGTGADYQIAEADILKEIGAVSAPAPRPSPVQGNPFRNGADYSVTGQMILMRNDPVLAEDMAAEAGVSLRRSR